MDSHLTLSRSSGVLFATLAVAACSRWGYDEPLDETQPFLWENPLPSGHALLSVWGTSADDFVAVGNQGAVVRFDGRVLREEILSPDIDLRGVWGVDSGNVFVVATQGRSFFFDGRVWTALPIVTAYDIGDVYGFSASDVFATSGYNGSLLHYNGAVWTGTSCGVGDASGLWGARPDRLFATAGGGTVWSSDGQLCALEQTFIGETLNDIWGADEDHLFVVGKTAAYRSAASVWTTEPIAGTQVLTGVSGSSMNDAVVVGTSGFGARWDGTTWQPMPSITGRDLKDVWVAPDGTAVAVGDNGLVARATGTTWEELTGGWRISLHALWSAADGTTFAADCAKILRRSPGGGWAEETLPANLPCINALWGRSATDVVAVGSTGSVTVYDGHAWTARPAATVTANFNAVTGNADSFFAVGDAGAIWTCRGNYCGVIDSSTTSALYGVWGEGQTFFAVGQQGTIIRFQADGAATGMFGYTDQTLNAVWGTSATDVFAVGSVGTILHYDGIAWSAMISPTNNTLYGVSGTSGNDVYAASGYGVILRYDGKAWAVQPKTGAYLDLTRVWVNELAQVWVAGEGGTVLKKEHRRE